MNILWIDDEIDLLKPHLIFLEKKGYQTTTSNNAADALDILAEQNFDGILIDENMPGMGGLEALQKIKEIRPHIPVIMVTKNEEEHIMEEAIGGHIADYLIKPVNPHQILSSLKKTLTGNKIISEKTVMQYQQEFRQISMQMMNARGWEDWEDIYKKLVHWEMELENVRDEQMLEILENQKNEANSAFFKFIQRNYESWLHEKEHPIMSHTVFKELGFPKIEKKKTLLLMIDNLRYDQWKAIEPMFTQHFNVASESLYYSILPSATQYARNAFFAGLLPLEIEKRFPQYWLNDTDEGNKNQFEYNLFQEQLKRLGKGNLSTKYYKILNSDFEKRVLDDFHNFKQNDLSIIVYNFIDILSHAKTDNKIVAEMIRDDKTYRSITKSWFENAYLMKIMELAAAEGMQVILTTDHGTIQVKEPSKVIGDRETSTNLRYKMGRNLKYDENDVFSTHQPLDLYLPKVNISSSYIFAKENLFLAYPKNYNHYVNYYKNSYQHGGISLEEIIIPFVELQPK